MSKANEGFIITPEGRVSLWIRKGRWTDDGFYFDVLNGNWRGRWMDTDDLLTNGAFRVADWRRDDWKQATFRHTPPAAPEFGHYNDAIHWMQQYIDGGK